MIATDLLRDIAFRPTASYSCPRRGEINATQWENAYAHILCLARRRGVQGLAKQINKKKTRSPLSDSILKTRASPAPCSPDRNLSDVYSEAMAAFLLFDTIASLSADDTGANIKRNKYKKEGKPRVALKGGRPQSNDTL